MLSLVEFDKKWLLRSYTFARIYTDETVKTEIKNYVYPDRKV